MIKLKNDRGSITIYIIVCVLFFLVAIVNVQTNLKNKESRIESEYQKIKASYQRKGEIDDSTLPLETLDV